MNYTLEELKKLKVNFHFNMFCNMRCNFCFYAVEVAKAKKVVNKLDDWIKIVEKLNVFKAINFAGGEPTLYWDELKSISKRSKEVGLKTSLITNGSLISKKEESDVLEVLRNFDTVGLSMDSSLISNNENSGRAIGGKSSLTKNDYKLIAERIKKAGCIFKINSVIHSQNYQEKLIDFIKELGPKRWKLMQVTDVKQPEFINYKITKAKFEYFIKNNSLDKPNNQFSTSIEDEETVFTSYVMIDGEGIFYDSNWATRKDAISLLEENVDLLKEFNKCGFNLKSQLERYRKEI
ncbi:radical SAM protein [Spiroplasma corruscae]|uniref:S-adenosylmethionine-dependent nucleotide dehydratase n=1 Tax=Spiroplasma corruscae TaxID=216934 RepID=A0A222EQ20_9MOLU|nr:viperin family antiviral radical SAM protein [Spiroplasma corruscae]ASP28343.1 radical SAM protein [Spiroplasma corruscae]